MAKANLPPSVIKNSVKGIKFVSSVDRASYTINELSRAAMKDVSKYIKYEMVKKMKKLPGLKKSRRPSKAIHSWVRPREADLQIGFGHDKKGLTGDDWYAIQQELGTNSQPKRSILRDTVYENIDFCVEL